MRAAFTTSMSDDYHPSTPIASKSWLERISQALSGEPQSREDLIDDLRAAKDKGLLDADTLSMLEGAITVSEKQAEDVMVPRGQLVMLAADDSFDDILKTVIESGHSRFPVYGEHPDDIIGVLLAKDLLRCIADQQRPCQVRAMLRPVHLIPESKRLNLLLKDFRANRQHLAMVVDEYGGISGLVTIEDVLEEIVGEIDDEHDSEEQREASIVHLGEGMYQVQAQTPIADFNAHFGAELDDSEADTIGGLVAIQVGHLPDEGETLTLGNHHVEVIKTDGRRLHTLHVRPTTLTDVE